MNTRPFLLALLLAASLGTAVAQAPLRQVEFYFDADAAALRPVLQLKDSSPAAVERLMRTVERRPGALLETAQLGHYAMRNGQREAGHDFYQRALAQMDLTHGQWRPVKWNYGWDLYLAGDTAGALQQWTDLAGRGVAASWMPPTFALAHWKLGRRDEAVNWYAAAVRTEPNDWSDPANHARLLPQWREEDRKVLADVYAAWAANPPRWP